MLHLYDRATTARALTLDLDPALRRPLTDRTAALPEELAGQTEYLVVEPGDTEADVVRHVGFSPLVEPIEGARFGERGFHPHWDWLGERDGWFEMIVSFGSSFAYVLLIARRDDELGALCRAFAG